MIGWKGKKTVAYHCCGKRQHGCANIEGGSTVNRCVKWIIRHRILVIALCLLSLVPACFGIASQKVSYDLVTYLPFAAESQRGQEILMREFGEGAVSLMVTEGLTERQEKELEEQLKKVEHVRSVLSYAGLTQGILPAAMLPDAIQKLIENGNARLCAVFFEQAASSEETLTAVEDMRRIAGKECFISGLASVFTDMRSVVRQEEAACVLAAVVIGAMVLMMLLDSFLAPLLILLSTGVGVLWNLGSNGFLHEISALSRPSSVVLQMAVTVIFPVILWHAYREKRTEMPSRDEAMVRAVTECVPTILGAGLASAGSCAALCTITFPSGTEMGVVMAKGVLLGMACSLLFFPCLLRLADGLVEKTAHRSLIPDAKGIARFVLHHDRQLAAAFAVLMIFAACVLPGLSVHSGLSLRQERDVPSKKAEEKLMEKFGIGSAHLMLIDADLSAKEVRSLTENVRKTEGIRAVFGMHTLTGNGIPEAFLPSGVVRMFRSGQHQLLLAASACRTDSAEMKEQVRQLTAILRDADPEGVLMGDASMIAGVEEDGESVVLRAAILALLTVMVILGLFQRSLLLPVLSTVTMGCVISAVLSIPLCAGGTLPAMTPFAMFSLQLAAMTGETLLVTDAYRKARGSGKPRREAVSLAVIRAAKPLITSLCVQASMLAAIDVASSIEPIVMTCRLAACATVLGMAAALLILPAFLILFDRIIVRTTAGMHRAFRQ